MLRLPRFEIEEPTSVDEAVGLLAKYGESAKPMAGGTDLLPNMKHEIVTPDVVVGLWRIEELRGIRLDGDRIRIGAGTSLHEVAESAVVRARLPSLGEAAAQVAGPQLRRMGTIGGNVCLDTRCVYINQTYFWRQALGFCIKKDGTVCHVVKGGRRCVAAASNDTAPVLMTLGATLVVQNASGPREVPVDEFYTSDGVFNQARSPGDLLVSIDVPVAPPRTYAAYTKLRTRAAIDFPELGVAVRVTLDTGGRATEADVCVTALASRPIRVKNIADLYTNRPFDAAVIDAIARAAYRRCKPLNNISTDPAYRREMVPVFVRRAFRQALERGNGTEAT